MQLARWGSRDEGVQAGQASQVMRVSICTATSKTRGPRSPECQLHIHSLQFLKMSHPIQSMISYSSSKLYTCNLKSSIHSPHRHLRFEAALLSHSVALCHSDMHPKSAENCIQPSNLYSISCCVHHTLTCTVCFDTPTAHVRRL